MDNKLLSIRAYLIEAKFYLCESDYVRALDYLQNALDIVDRKRLGDFEDGYLKEITNI